MKLSQRIKSDILRIQKKWLLQGEEAVRCCRACLHYHLPGAGLWLIQGMNVGFSESMSTNNDTRQSDKNNLPTGYILRPKVGAKPLTHELTCAQRSDVTCHWLYNFKTHFLTLNCLPHLSIGNIWTTMWSWFLIYQFTIPFFSALNMTSHLIQKYRGWIGEGVDSQLAML